MTCIRIRSGSVIVSSSANASTYSVATASSCPISSRVISLVVSAACPPPGSSLFDGIPVLRVTLLQRKIVGAFGALYAAFEAHVLKTHHTQRHRHRTPWYATAREITVSSAMQTVRVGPTVTSLFGAAIVCNVSHTNPLRPEALRTSRIRLLLDVPASVPASLDRARTPTACKRPGRAVAYQMGNRLTVAPSNSSAAQ